MVKYLFSFLFIVSLLSAEEPYITSENDSLALVEGIFNAYNGKLVQINKDIEVLGSDPLELVRYYDGGHHFSSNHGYGVGFSFPVKLSFDSGRDIKNVKVEQREGSYLFFDAIDQKNKHFVGKINPDYLKLGYTNCCETLLRGEPDIYAMQVDGTKYEFTIDLGNGVKRYYERSDGTKAKTREFRLKREDRANGNHRHFSYKKGKLERVWTTNRDDSLTLNWMNFSYGKHSYTVTASNGQVATYQLKNKEGKAKQYDGIYCYQVYYNKDLLTKVSGPHLPLTEYDFLKKAEFKSSIFSVKKVKRQDGRSLEVKYDKKEKIKNVILSGEKTPLYTFDYHENYTHVIDALGNLCRYDFTARRLTKLTEPHHTKIYQWNDRGQLLSQTINSPNGQKVSQRDYQYNPQGFITETRITGNIIQKDSQDCYIIRYFYSEDGRNNLLAENHNWQKEYSYTYLPNTNLVTRKLTFADQMFVEREFYHYDNNGIMIQKIVDDGSSPDFNDFTNVTYRKIIEIEPLLKICTNLLITEESYRTPAEQLC